MWEIHTHTHTHTHTHAGMFFSHEKKEILPLMITWMELEGIMLNEIRQRIIYTAWYHLYMESKKAKLIVTESRTVVARGCEVGKLGRDVGQRVEISS